MEFTDELLKEVLRLQSRRQELVNEIASLDTELKDCEAALRVAQKLGAIPQSIVIPEASPTDSVLYLESPRNEPKFKGKVNKLALHILKNGYPTGMAAGEIRRIAAKKHETDIKSTTLTVALGRYKATGEVRLDGRIWFYVPAKRRKLLKQTEAPAVTEAPETGGLPPSSSGRTPDLLSGEAGSKPAGGTTF